MLIRCWGSRGSISVSGKDFQKYGGDTTCLEVVSNKNDLVILDAGTGIRLLGNRLVAEGDKRVINILLSHAHWDHLAGFPFFKPIYMKDYRIRIFGPLSTQESLRSIISKTMSHPYFPIEFEDISADITFHEMDHSAVDIGAFQVEAIPLSHPNQGFGYKFSEDGKSFVFLTDNELTHQHEGGKEFKDYVEFAKDVDLLIHDAEYTREEYALTKGWGHSVYLDTLDLALKANVAQFGLFHINQDRTDNAEDKIVEDCKRIVAEKGSKLRCFAVASGMEIKL
ncbi:MAG: MBL fold metallo-hydrolase [Proteobacteria bacterium]|nr:MBL fold metallo-hydrolase [Pseudomonadota bacterium]